MEGDRHRPTSGSPAQEPSPAAGDTCEHVALDTTVDVTDEDSQEELAQGLVKIQESQEELTTHVPATRPRISGFLVPSATGEPPVIQPVQPVVTATKNFEAVDKMTGRGLSVTYRFARTPFIQFRTMVNINMTFINHTCEAIKNIRIENMILLSEDMSMIEFSRIHKLPPNGCLPAAIGIDFNDVIQEAEFEIACSLGTFHVTILPTAGELIRPVVMSKEVFAEKQARLLGDREHVGHMKYAEDALFRVTECANLGVCDDADINFMKFSGQTLKNADLVLVTFKNKESITVQCENEVFGAVLLHEIMQHLQAPLA